MVEFLVIPQWQGSGSARAMRLIDGAQAIRGDLPSASTRVIEIPTEAGESQQTGVHRITSLCTIRDRVVEALHSSSDPVIVIGGDCGVELAPIAHTVRRTKGRTAILWFDAHPDLNTPESSPSGAFHGMVVRTLLGSGTERLVPDAASRLDPELLVLAGARAFDDPEADFVEEENIAVLSPSALSNPDGLVSLLREKRADSVYVHVDLDVLDPGEIEGIGYPEPFGLTLADLLACIAAVRAEFPLAGGGITEFAPASPEAAGDDMSAILRIVAAIAGPRT